MQLMASPFTWGLLIGLVLLFLNWRSMRKDKVYLKTELARVHNECAELQQHLSTQLKINAKGNEQLQLQLEELRQQNETLRGNVHVLQQKPGKAELRRLEVVEAAVSVLREQAPGFAPAWEKALRQAEEDYQASESGFKKLMRKVVPQLRSSSKSEEDKVTRVIEEEDA